MSAVESGMSLDQNLFQLTCLVSASDIRLSARSEVGQRQLLALVMGCGDLTFYYLSGEAGQLPVMRRVPWFSDSNKSIMALCFDPSGCWLLVAGFDGSIFIVPALSLVDPNAMLDHRWSATDITSFSSPLYHPNLHSSSSCKPVIQDSHPTSIVWWQILLEGQHIAIMGTDAGDLIFVSLSTGLQVGITYVRAKVSMLHICQDNNLDSVFLLVTSDNRSQWKLLLEQRATGYAWPIDRSGSAVKVVTSNSELSSSSHNSLDLEYGNRNIPHLPTARSRLQGLKQLSVEKLTNLRQRLAETRSKGAAAMGVNMHFRRESSGSSSDDTTCSSTTGKLMTVEGSDTPPVSHHVTTGPQPEKLSLQVGDTFLCPQYARGRYLLSGYFAPTSILTIHGMNLDVVPLFVHKLAPYSKDVLVTDKFLYVTDMEGRHLSIVSCQLSESRLDGDAELNPESIIETYEMKGEDERILSVYKRTDSRSSTGFSSKSGSDKDSLPQVSFDSKSRGSTRERKSSQVPFTLPKCVKDLKLDKPSVDTCVIVTNGGVYEVSLRISPTKVFMDLVLTHQALEKAEKLALVFGLNLQQLLEGAGDLKLYGREFPQAIALYKYSRCRHLKSVLKFAAGGHAAELLSYITLLFSTSGIELTTSERIHLSNLAVMSYTEQVLRAAAGKVILLKQFLKFLRENLYYDEVLAVNVAGQTALWEVLQFLASYRGLHPEVLDILTKIVRPLGEGLVRTFENKTANIDIRNLPALDSGLWLCVSDPSLLQSLLARPQQARIHLQYVRICLPHLEQFALQRLAALYDPSSPQLRPNLKRMFKFSRRRERSGGSYSSYSSVHLDSVDLLDPVDELFVPCEDIVQTFLLVLLYLAKKRQATSSLYMPELMEKIQLANDDDEDSEELCPSLPVNTNSLSAGFSHVALIRNGAIYTWGNAVQGCLGTGPLMSRYSCAQQVALMPSLKLEVISVSCGRQHTLALTNNGVYAWGSSQFGQLGIEKTGQCPYPRLVEQLCRERIIAVSAGQYHSIALADDGRVFTWGWGVHGQLGHQSVEDCHTPRLVERLIGKVVIQVCGGHGHTLVLTAEGQVYTFGSSVFGQLGNGSNTKSSVPVHVASLTERITMITTSYFHNLALSSSNKLYVWGSSPQVLRLQAQAQKKARLLHHQQSSSVSTPSSPSKSVQVQQEATVQTVSPAKHASDTFKDPRESSSTYHNPTFIESLDSELPDSNLTSVSGALSSSQTSSSSRVSPVKKQCVKSETTSQSSLPNSSLNNNVNIPIVTSAKCHKLPADGSNRVVTLGNKKNDSSHIPITVNEPEMLETLNSKNYIKSGPTEKDFESVSDSNLPLYLKHTSSSSVFSDLENANVDSKPDGSVRASSTTRRDHHSFNLQVKQNFTPLTTSSAECYSIPTLIVSPTMEFKGLTSGRSPSIDNYFDVTEPKSSTPCVKSEGNEDMQPHLMPQLVDTSLVVGPITQISCGCHHSALITREGVLYVWGRNLDGQLGNGTRKEILNPTPLCTPPATTAAAGPSVKGLSQVSMSRSPSLSGIMTGGDKLRFRQVSCGCEFTVAQENSSTGKVWAWGNNSQAQLGHAPIEDSKPLEGKFVMLKTTKRVIKLPHGTQNSSDIPREVPGLPSSTITFKYDNMSGFGGWCNNRLGTSTELCPPLCSIEEPCYGLRTLHFAFQHFHGYYDSSYLLNKCLELENYQGAAKLAALDRHYHLALAYQLKALGVASAEKGFDLGKQFDNQSTNLNQEITEKISNINKDLLTDITNSNKATDRCTTQYLSSENKKESTNFSSNSNVNNGARDNNSNPLILDTKGGPQPTITNGNSNYMKIQKSEANKNIVSSEAKKIEDNSKIIPENEEKKLSEHKNGDSKIRNDENEILSHSDDAEECKISSNEIENKNKKNAEINLNNSSTNTKAKDTSVIDSAKEKSKVEFSEKINSNISSKSNSPEGKSLEVGEKAPDQGKSAIDKTTEEIDSSSSISTPESLASTNAPDSEMHAFAVQGGTEQMSEGHRYLTSPDSSTSPLASEEQSLLSPESCPQVVDQSSQKSDINLIPINVNGDLQNTKATIDEGKTNLNKDISHKADSVPLTVPQNSVNGSGLDGNSPSSTPTVQNNSISVASKDVFVREQNRKSEMDNKMFDNPETSHVLHNGKIISTDKTKLSKSDSVLGIDVSEYKNEGAKITNLDVKCKDNFPSENKENEEKKSVSPSCIVKTRVFQGKEVNGALSTKQSSSDRTDLENYENELKDSDKTVKTNVADNLNGETEKLTKVLNSQCVLAEKTDPSLQTGGMGSLSSRTSYERTAQEGDFMTNPSVNEVNETSSCKDLVAQAAVIVEYYVSVMEEDSHAMMSRLLQQGIEFWLSHSLPVDHLENLLLKHMSKFFYPLGLLLFCKDGSSEEEEMEKKQTAVSMLNHLSTRFSLQLCSNLLSHIDQKKAYPEYIELLAQITSIQTSPSLNGCCITGQGLAQSPEQLMEAILEGLGAMKGLGGTLGQPYINYQEEVQETYKDASSEAAKLEQLLAFSCGHRYGRSVFHQSVLPELELGLLQLHHPLPNTARVLKGLFDSNSPNLHLACPRCVLSYLQSQTMPTL